jgi:hypothetical protein
MPWNVGDHARKFLRGHGRYIDHDDTLGEVNLVFWGEWEAPSRVVTRWRDRHGPRALHDPYWCTPPRGPRQNTDPWVFGEAFRYSNCRQLTAGHHRPSRMQRLTTGSVIIFGSTVRGEFVVDTVFVVASAHPWTPADLTAIPADEAFRTCTAQSLAGGRHSHSEFTLYTGATLEHPVNGMHSFVPARRFNDPDARFERPPLRLPSLINPKSTQSTLGTKRPMAPASVQEAWNTVRHQVLDADCLLAVHLDTPPKELPL